MTALPSWNGTATKQAVLDFVTAVTDETGSPLFQPIDRIATFDNDGTPWCENPMYILLD